MDKKTISLTIDYDVWLEAKARHENLSGHVNDLLKSEVNIKNKELDPKVLKKIIEAKEKLIEVLVAKEEQRKKEKEAEDNVIMRF